MRDRERTADAQAPDREDYTSLCRKAYDGDSIEIPTPAGPVFVQLEPARGQSETGVRRKGWRYRIVAPKAVRYALHSPRRGPTSGG